MGIATLANTADLLRRLLFRGKNPGGTDTFRMLDSIEAAWESGLTPPSVLSFDQSARPMNRIFADPESQKNMIRSLFSFLPFNEEMLEAAGTPPRIEKDGPRFTSVVLTPYLSNPYDTMLMYLILYSMRFGDHFRCHFTQCEGWQIDIDGASFPDDTCVRWEVIDMGTGWDPGDKSNEVHKVPHHGILSPHFGVLATMWHSPKIVEAMRECEFPTLYIPSMIFRDECSPHLPRPTILDFSVDPCGSGVGFDAFGPGGLDCMICSSPRLLLKL